MQSLLFFFVICYLDQNKNVPRIKQGLKGCYLRKERKKEWKVCKSKENSVKCELRLFVCVKWRTKGVISIVIGDFGGIFCETTTTFIKNNNNIKQELTLRSARLQKLPSDKSRPSRATVFYE